YLRATGDDGRILGSAQNSEARIFLNAQTWAVINGVADSNRAERAMNSVEEILDREYGPLLFYPAFTHADEAIGYLSRYAPGVRENGGLYTHAATWAIMAECILGRGERAYQMYTKLCPINRGMNPDLYFCEPYVTPGNVEGPDSPHFGRGGWTWYTGSAAWLFQVCVEWILGIRPTYDGLLIDPCIPKHWENFKMKRLFRGDVYEIEVVNPNHVNKGVVELVIDGRSQKSNLVTPFKNGEIHRVRVIMG
ncbi:glycosyl transferase family 36, partial [Candidatus Bathyarchaeota archaeon]